MRAWPSNFPALQMPITVNIADPVATQNLSGISYIRRKPIKVSQLFLSCLDANPDLIKQVADWLYDSIGELILLPNVPGRAADDTYRVVEVGGITYSVGLATVNFSVEYYG